MSSLSSPSADKIILALDVPTTTEARFLVEQTQGLVGYYKIGLGFLTRGGLELARDLVKEGHKIFLDLKLFDIHQTVEDSVARLADLGVHIMTVHGDPHVVKAAVSGRRLSGRENDLGIYGVTILTSLEDQDLHAMGFEGQTIADVAAKRAVRVFEAGGTGVISSAHEVARIKSLCSPLKVITPGIRLAEGATHDQKRVMTPAQAVAQGSDHLVIGRQITHSPHARETAQLILNSLTA